MYSRLEADRALQAVPGPPKWSCRMETVESMGTPDLGVLYFTLSVFMLLCLVIALFGWRALRKGPRRRTIRRC
jgi:hypothetical protein